jgi:hypothetical protein
MTADPPIATVTMRPMARDPYPARMRRLGPTTAYSYISTVAGFPFFIDPDVPGAGSNRPGNRTPNGMNRYIHLGRCRHRTCGYDQHRQKCQFYCFTLHMLVFKLNNFNAKTKPPPSDKSGGGLLSYVWKMLRIFGPAF